MDAGVRALVDRARREVDEGILPAVQVALARDGELVCFEAFGTATRSSRILIWSCTKALVGAAVWLLVGEDRLRYTDRVAEHIPEFASNGKRDVTVEHVLLHTGGFPRAPLGPPAWSTRDGRLAAFEQWRLNWEPGSRFEYHGLSAHWVLAELVERLSGADYRAFIRERITGPLDLERFELGVPLDDQADIVDACAVGEQPTRDDYASIGLVPPPPGAPDVSAAIALLDSPQTRELGVPGGGAVSSAADVAMLYQALLRNPGEMWRPEVLADATGVVRNTFPDPARTAPVPVNRTRGLVVAGDDGLSHLRMNFGRTVSPQTFGHDGAGGQIAWADPVTGLSFCYLTAGMDRNLVRGAARGEALSSLAAVCA